MLVLTRKSGESLMIGDTIEITIVSVRGGQVKLGIQAPSDVAIYRKELYEKIKQENLKAAGGTQNAKIISLAEIILKDKK